jgi:hypothetical protein
MGGVVEGASSIKDEDFLMALSSTLSSYGRHATPQEHCAVANLLAMWA